MSNRKKTILSSVILLVVSITAVTILLINRNYYASSVFSDQSIDLVLFYGTGCPHCLVLDNYLQENKVEEKMLIIKKEVYYDKKNAQDLKEATQSCGLSSGLVGVPLLWSENNCYLGDQEIINFLETKY